MTSTAFRGTSCSTGGGAGGGASGALDCGGWIPRGAREQLDSRQSRLQREAFQAAGRATQRVVGEEACRRLQSDQCGVGMW